MILSFINIRKVPREGWKHRASPSVFNTSPGTLRRFDPSIHLDPCGEYKARSSDKNSHRFEREMENKL